MVLPYDVHKAERHWRAEWAKHHCFEAPDTPPDNRFFNFDSGPFPSGDLHMGHVRTYSLGDVMARYQRLRGFCVLYATEFDAFGLPNELAARSQSISPREYTERCITAMTTDLKHLGVSYDWRRVPATCDASYYRWTQWLFLKLFHLGLVDRRRAEQDWCPSCSITLSRMQIDKGLCWRCGTQAEKRSMEQWFVCLSRYSQRLSQGLEKLNHWSERSRNLLRAFIGAEGGASRIYDWSISRQRSWGTPIPIVHCSDCGPVTVPESELPVRLPDDLDWSQIHPLAAANDFVATSCPACGSPARRETDTLDCFFDDIWCHMSGLKALDSEFSFDGRDLAWMPVDCFHSGLDTFFYLHLYRFLGFVLHDDGLVQCEEPIRSYMGHDMVLRDGRKMSKHLGNSVSPAKLMEEHGADALRVGVLWSAAPERTVEWREASIERAGALLRRIYALYDQHAQHLENAAARGEPSTVLACSRAAGSLERKSAQALERIRKFVEEYRPNAAIEELATWSKAIEGYVRKRPDARHWSQGDAESLYGTLRSFAIALSPFAPHLAETVWERLGCPPFVCRAQWPVGC